VLFIKCSLTKNKGLPYQLWFLSMHFYYVISLLIARWIIYEEVAVYHKCALVSVMLLVRILLSTPRSINPW
jgi:hypothetical protein